MWMGAEWKFYVSAFVKLGFNVFFKRDEKCYEIYFKME